MSEQTEAPTTEAPTTPAAPAEAPAAVSADPAVSEAAELTPFQAAVAALKAKAEAAPAAPVVETKPPVEAPPTEPPAEPAKTETKPEDPITSRFSKLVEEQRQMRLAKEAMEADKAEIQQYKGIKDLFQVNPLEAMKRLGVEGAAMRAAYERLTDQVLAGGKQPAEAGTEEVRQQVAAVRAEVERMRAEAQQVRESALQQAFLADIKTKVVDGSDKYQLVRAFGAEHEAMQVVESYYRQTGEILGGSRDKAIELALEQLESQYEQLAARALTVEKVKSKVAGVASKQAVATPGPQANSGQRPVPRTLTNSQAGAAKPPPEPDNLTDDELRARAARILNGQV